MNNPEELLIIVQVVAWIIGSLFITCVPVVLSWWLKKRDAAAKIKAEKEEAFITRTNDLLEQISEDLKIQTRWYRGLNKKITQTGEAMSNLDIKVTETMTKFDARVTKVEEHLNIKQLTHN